jgi:hypothetical protein
MRATSIAARDFHSPPGGFWLETAVRIQIVVGFGIVLGPRASLIIQYSLPIDLATTVRIHELHLRYDHNNAELLAVTAIAASYTCMSSPFVL